MKNCLNNRTLPLVTILLGAVTLVLRTGLLLLGTDSKGLLVPGHPLDLLSWAVTFVTAAILAAGVRRLDGSDAYGDNFGPSPAAALGAFALAGSIAVTLACHFEILTRRDRLWNLLSLLAVAGLIAVGICRWKGRRPFFLCHGVACLYFLFYAVGHYQPWCSRPQLQTVFFSMVAVLLLALFAYYQTAFDVDLGKGRMQLLTGLLAGFFCIAAIPGGEDALLYLCGAVWSLTNLCSRKSASEGDSHGAA